MTYLSVPDIVGAKQWYCYVVDLASEQIDYQNVPNFTRTIDVVVSQPTQEAIGQLVTACGWLKSCEIVSDHELCFDEAPF